MSMPCTHPGVVVSRLIPTFDVLHSAPPLPICHGLALTLSRSAPVEAKCGVWLLAVFARARGSLPTYHPVWPLNKRMTAPRLRVPSILSSPSSFPTTTAALFPSDRKTTVDQVSSLKMLVSGAKLNDTAIRLYDTDSPKERMFSELWKDAIRSAKLYYLVGRDLSNEGRSGSTDRPRLQSKPHHPPISG